MSDFLKSDLYLFHFYKLPDDENVKFDLIPNKNILETLLSIDLVGVPRKVITDFQPQRIQKDNIFTINESQIYALNVNPEVAVAYNYAILAYKDSNNQIIEDSLLCFRIQKMLWNGVSSCKIYCKLDVLNTLQNVHFKNNCIIERAHINRFEGITGDYLIPRIDFHEEPIEEPVKYITEEASLNSIIQEPKWNLVYYSDPNVKNAIRVLLIPDTKVQNIQVRILNVQYLTISDDRPFVIRSTENLGKTITFNGNAFTFGTSGYAYEEAVCFKNANGYNVLINGYEYDPSGDLNFIKDNLLHTYTTPNDNKIYLSNHTVYYKYPTTVLSVLTGSNYFPIWNTTKETAYLSSGVVSVDLEGLNEIDLTNPRIIKIVSCVALPFDIRYSPALYVNISDDYMNINCVEYVSTADFPLQSLFSSTGLISSIAKPSSFDRQAHDIKYETKLLNSKYKEYAFEYNAYKITLPIELLRLTSTNYQIPYTMKYKQSRLKSDLLFKFEHSNAIKNDIGGLPSPQTFYLISDVDNEKPIYTNDYINYMKTGYNFDKANMNRQTTVSTALAATSILGGLAGIAAGAATGGVSAAAGISLITSGLSSSINIINNKIAAEADIQRKITSYKNSGTGVAGVNALDLRKEYKAYDLYRRVYDMSYDVKHYIYDFFREYGYQLNIVGNPESYMNSRRYFNYIKLGKCEFTAQTKEIYAQQNELLEEYRRITQEGYFILHPYTYHLGVDITTYDFEREYENFERSLDNE